MEENIMRAKQKGFIILAVVLTLFCMPSMILATMNNGQLDAVLVIDASGSMQETDPNKLGLEGVKLFVDMVASTGNQIGIVTYGSEVDATYPLTLVKTQDDKEKIKSFVDGLRRDLEYTDITAGLGKALEMENQRDTSLGNNPLIIIFTDGNNAVGGVANRNNQKIDADLAKMLDEAKGANYPIYTIGLNHNGKLNEAYLKNISDETNARAFATKDPKELPDILTEIFAVHSNLKIQNLGILQGTGDFEEIKVSIPNSNVLEANISVTSSNPVEFKLEDPNGASIIIPSTDVTLHESQSYHLLKLKTPVKGDWKLYVKGMAGDQINIDLVYNYDIAVEIKSLASNQFGKGDALEIIAYLSIQGNPISDDSLYQSAEATMVIKDITTNVETRIIIQANGGQFEGSYELKEEGDFEVFVLVEDTSYQRQSQPVNFKVGKGGEGILDDYSSEEKKTSSLFYLGSGIGVIAILAGILVALKKVGEANKPLVGQVVIELRDNNTGKLTSPQYKKLNVYKGKVSLHALVQFAPELKEAENIILKAGQKDKVLLINKSAYAIEKLGRVVKAETGLEMKKGDRFSINMADSGQTIQIEYLL